MQPDLREFVASVIGAMAMPLISVVLIATLTLPWSLHHHIGAQPHDAIAHSTHMT